ncbi:MAG: cell division protein FtsL [Gammaproteobacteria bacterium]|nr:cell division protein FtsL [Gammaproteobacteria bacterium]
MVIKSKTQVKSRPITLKTMAHLVVLLMLTTVSATGVIYSTHKSRYLLNELRQLERQRNNLQVEWGQLLLEQSSLVAQGRIENLAIAELGMKIPTVENVVVVTGD